MSRTNQQRLVCVGKRKQLNDVRLKRRSRSSKKKTNFRWRMKSQMKGEEEGRESVLNKATWENVKMTMKWKAVTETRRRKNDWRFSSIYVHVDNHADSSLSAGSSSVFFSISLIVLVKNCMCFECGDTSRWFLLSERHPFWRIDDDVIINGTTRREKRNSMSELNIGEIDATVFRDSNDGGRLELKNTNINILSSRKTNSNDVQHHHHRRQTKKSSSNAVFTWTRTGARLWNIRDESWWSSCCASWTNVFFERNSFCTHPQSP